MSEIFLIVFEMTQAGIVIIGIVAVVCLIFRWLKIPRAINCLLWMIVAFRLLCPFSFSSSVSILNLPMFQERFYSAEEVIHERVGDYQVYVKGEKEYQKAVDAGVKPKGGAEISTVYTKEDGVTPADTFGGKWMNLAGRIWFLGVVMMIFYSFLSYVGLKRRIMTAVRLFDNVYVSDRIDMPFVSGIVRPCIYLPLMLEEKEASCILEHEKMHIRRLDYLVKPVYFLALCLHWFNPLVWLWFKGACGDMECACDEAVLRKLGGEIRADYSQSLLNMAKKKKRFHRNPLAFGENQVKERIEHVLKYKRPAFWLIAISAIVGAAVGMIVLANPMKTDLRQSVNDEISSEVSSEVTVKLQPAVWSASDNLGADSASLDFASDEYLIFHGYFGLFVYDLQKQDIIRSINLHAIGCDKTQGDDYCEVMTDKNGETVWMHPLSSSEMFRYSVSANKLEKLAYEEIPGDILWQSETVDNTDNLSEINGIISWKVAEFEDGDYGYLMAGDWTIGSLCYIRGEKRIPLFGEIEVQEEETAGQGEEAAASEYVEALSVQELAKAEQTARDYYVGTVFELLELRQAKASHVIALYSSYPEYGPGELIIFEAETSHSEASRGIVLIRKDMENNEWTVINEGY